MLVMPEGEVCQSRHSIKGEKMGRIFVDNTRKAKTRAGEMRTNVFADKRTAKLGTEKKPAVVQVQTEERRQEIEFLFKEHGWKYVINLDPDKPENIVDLERLLHPPKPMTAEKKIGRNALCPCGSGNKYKKCCGQ
jgi:SWIM/SEC-C metal-binding protein